MRNFIRKLIPNSWLSIRKIYDSSIIFRSKDHLNLFFFKDYELKVWRRVNELVNLKSGDIILDIGANIGQAMLVLHNIFPENEIYSYEPQPKEFDFSLINRLLNNIPGHSINKAVISGHQSVIDLFIDNNTGGRKSSLVDSSLIEKVQVKAVNFGDLIRPEVKLIKIDIEGYEAQLITPYQKILEDVILIVEVRLETLIEIVTAFIDTHDIIHLETGNALTSASYNIEFGNLLLLPKKD